MGSVEVDLGRLGICGWGMRGALRLRMMRAQAVLFMAIIGATIKRQREVEVLLNGNACLSYQMRSDGSEITPESKWRSADRFGGRGSSVESKPSSVIERKANVRRKRKGALFKYKEDFIDTV